MSEFLLEVKGLKMYYPVTAGLLRRHVADIKAVDGVDFQLRPGEVLGIVGESGCGKSTLGRAALRLAEPTGGEIFFEGADLRAFNKQQLRSMRKEAQFVFQDPYASLNPRKTIGENIGEALLYHGLVSDREKQSQIVAEILMRVGLTPDAMQRYPHQFSGGQQQRICIGRAIALRPKLIVCDEAVSALDVSVQAQILNLLMELQKTLGLSYLFMSHDLSIIRHLTDRVLVLYLGKVMETATTEELFSNPKHPYTQALLSAIPRSHPHEKKERMVLKGEIPSAMNPPSGCPFRTRCPFAQPICAEPPPHKKVFDRGTGRDDHEYYCILD
ncbi:MAG: ATP-binding cassette domain-containing protein [Parachlamydia sp.]|nr:ATP-binding cassette domain-containing protein [Parachlamydia sp.]